jgi:DNA-binding MarR family transcriptional regulator
MELIRATGMLQIDRTVPGTPISMSQAFALHELDRDPPLSQRDLATRLGLEKSTVSRMAGELERKGLLERERDPGNRRLYRLRLTDRGRTVHARLAGSFHHLYLHWVAAMTGAEAEALVTGLGALVRAIHADPAHRPEAAQPPRQHHPATLTGG